ncbi:hypothetical protein ACTWPB_27935 [Nocardia sp. IBHARD005]|uniref:hypothetical protein n=1 Tax=Nocardia sp. IBHARD005 TaxID=3457765 RepID=UPI0040591406
MRRRFADRGGWLRRASQPLSHYRYRRLPKATGARLVEAPKVRLREIHWIGETSPHRRDKLLAMADRVDWTS